MALPFSLLMFSAGIWCLFYTLEICTINTDIKIWWAKLRFIGLAPLSTLWLFVGIEHMQNSYKINKNTYMLLGFIPLVIIILSLTSSYHTLFRYNYSVVNNGYFTMVTYKNDIIFLIYALYSYTMAITTGIILHKTFSRHNIIQRRQTILISFAIIFFIIVDILFQFGITPIKGYTLSPAALCISGIMMGIAIFYYRILDIAPITRKMIMNSIADIIIVIDDNSRIVECNRAAVQTFGKNTESLEGFSLLSIHPYLTEIKNSNGINYSKKLIVNDQEKYFEISSETVLFNEKYPVGRLIHLRDITDHKRLENELIDKINRVELLQQQLKEQAIRDPLTGAFNRRYLDEILERDFSFMQRNSQPVSFVMIDIDHFKKINDTWGHQAGDAVLKKLSSILMGHTRKSDIVCRYGGEEFLIVLNGSESDDAYRIIEKIRIAFKSSNIEFHGNEIAVTLSGGVSSFPTNGSNPIELIRKSDDALYRAKKSGRDRIEQAM